MNQVVYSSFLPDSCPACGQPIPTSVCLEVAEMDFRPDENGKVEMLGVVAGFAVNHDCLPKASRHAAI